MVIKAILLRVAYSILLSYFNSVSAKIPVAEEGDYIGCFRDEADSDLYGYMYEDHTDNSPDTCTNTCRTKGKKAGI